MNPESKKRGAVNKSVKSGKVSDPILESRMDRINKDYFCFEALPRIKWSKGEVKKRYKRIIFGTYDIRKTEIRIHPILKNTDIPYFVLDFVIYHELLHYEDYAIAGKSTRKHSNERIHNRDFHARENAFSRIDEAGTIMKSIANGDFNKKSIVVYTADDWSLFPEMP